jgi:hypothetical protein
MIDRGSRDDYHEWSSTNDMTFGALLEDDSPRILVA